MPENVLRKMFCGDHSSSSMGYSKLRIPNYFFNYIMTQIDPDWIIPRDQAAGSRPRRVMHIFNYRFRFSNQDLVRNTAKFLLGLYPFKNVAGSRPGSEMAILDSVWNAESNQDPVKKYKKKRAEGAALIRFPDWAQIRLNVWYWTRNAMSGPGRGYDQIFAQMCLVNWQNLVQKLFYVALELLIRNILLT